MTDLKDRVKALEKVVEELNTKLFELHEHVKSVENKYIVLKKKVGAWPVSF